MPIFTNRRLGVVRPIIRSDRPRIINVNSKKGKDSIPINLSKLLKFPQPVICVKRRLGGIGDVLMTTPMLRAIKELIPNCKLVYATDLVYSNGALADIINHNPFVDELISIKDIKESDYNYSVDVTSTGLSKERAGQIPPNRIDMFAEAAGVSVDNNPVPIYEVSLGERDLAQQEINTYLDGRDRDKTNIIAIQARSNDHRRTWPAKQVQELADLLSDRDDTIVLLFDWGHLVGTWIAKDNLHLVLSRDFIDTAGLVEQVDVIVCPDSSMLHLAGALNKKIVTIFGPIPPESRINHYANATAVIHRMNCHPCFYTPKCHKNDSKNHLECLTSISAKEVYDAVMKKIIEPLNIPQIVTMGKDLSVANQDAIIMVRRNSTGWGDLMMATTGIEALKIKYPTKKIHVAVPEELMCVLENNPYIDEVVPFSAPINYKRYFLVADITSPCAKYECVRLRTGKLVEKNRVEIYAEALGVKELISNLKPRYYVSEEETLKAKEFFKLDYFNPNKKTIALVLESAEIYRSWPMESNIELIGLLREKYNVLCVGKKNSPIEGILSTCNLNIRETSAIVSLCDLVVTPDTGVLHLAAALNIPTVALFGPIDYRARCRGYKNVTVIKSDSPCSPCWRNGNTKCNQTGEIKSYSKCLKDIPANKVILIINQKLQEGFS